MPDFNSIIHRISEVSNSEYAAETSYPSLSDFDGRFESR